MSTSEQVKQWRRRMKARIVAAMGGKCQCCGYSACDAVLSMHHLDPSKKEISFGALRSRPIDISLVIPELHKCALVCANCHGEIHAGVRTAPERSPFNEPMFRSLISERQPRINGRFGRLKSAAIV